MTRREVATIHSGIEEDLEKKMEEILVDKWRSEGPLDETKKKLDGMYEEHKRLSRKVHEKELEIERALKEYDAEFKIYKKLDAAYGTYAHFRRFRMALWRLLKSTVLGTSAPSS